MTARPAWTTLAPGVHVWRYPVLDVNVTVVTGDGYALVVDTLSTAAQAGALAAGLAGLGVTRYGIVNTHHHFDHCFGNATLTGEIWAHAETCRLLRDDPDALVAAAVERHGADHPELADGLPSVRLRAPDHAVREPTTLDVGGRPVELVHPGRGHTAGDLVVRVPDADVLIVGDLVEQGAPPNFDEAYPLDWPDTVAALLPWATGPVVPGHGAVVDGGFVAEQHAGLAELAWRIREGHADGAPVAEVAGRAGPFDGATRRTAVLRGYAELSGRDA